MTRVLVLLVGLFAAAPVGFASQSAPELASCFALPSTGLMDALLTGDDVDKPAQVQQTASVPSRVVVSDERAEQLRLQFERGSRTHRTGVILAIGGAIVVPTSGIVLLGAAFGGNEPVAAIAAVTFIGSSIAYITGGVMASMGAITATRAVNEVLGLQLPMGVAWGGVVLSTVGLIAIPLGGIGLAGPLLGAVCGAIQMSTANRALYRAGLASIQVMPTTNGLQLVGRF